MTISRKQDLIRLFIFLQALIAMLGSLYYSNFGDPIENLKIGAFWIYGYGFDPCLLCYWARILMYPIVAISLVGLIKKAKDVYHYILPLSIAGVFLDSYHFLLQKTSIGNPFACTGANPCSALQVDYLGFITIPFQALAAFLIITILCIIHMKLNNSNK
jgi:disulfide bond formation protein DsbB